MHFQCISHGLAFRLEILLGARVRAQRLVAIDGSAHRPHEKPRLRVKRVQRPLCRDQMSQQQQGSTASPCFFFAARESPVILLSHGTERESNKLRDVKGVTKGAIMATASSCSSTAVTRDRERKSAIN